MPYFSSLSIFYGGWGSIWGNFLVNFLFSLVFWVFWPVPVGWGGLGFLVDLIRPRSIVFSRTIFPFKFVNSFQICLGFFAALGSFWHFFFGLVRGVMFFGTFLLWANFLLQFFVFFVG